MSVMNTIELEGVSDKSWGEAAREALREASKTIRGINRMEVLNTSTRVDGDRIAEYRTPTNTASAPMTPTTSATPPTIAPECTRRSGPRGTGTGVRPQHGTIGPCR